MHDRPSFSWALFVLNGPIIIKVTKDTFTLLARRIVEWGTVQSGKTFSERVVEMDQETEVKEGKVGKVGVTVSHPTLPTSAAAKEELAVVIRNLMAVRTTFNLPSFNPALRFWFTIISTFSNGLTPLTYCTRDRTAVAERKRKSKRGLDISYLLAFQMIKSEKYTY